MNKNNSKWAFASVGGQFKQREHSRMKAGVKQGFEEQHLLWGERQVMFVGKHRVMGSWAGSAVIAATQTSLGSL